MLLACVCRGGRPTDFLLHVFLFFSPRPTFSSISLNVLLMHHVKYRTFLFYIFHHFLFERRGYGEAVARMWRGYALVWKFLKINGGSNPSIPAHVLLDSLCPPCGEALPYLPSSAGVQGAVGQAHLCCSMRNTFVF